MAPKESAPLRGHTDDSIDEYCANMVPGLGNALRDWAAALDKAEKSEMSRIKQKDEARQQNGFVATKYINFVDFVKQIEQNRLTKFVNFEQN